MPCSRSTRRGCPGSSGWPWPSRRLRVVGAVALSGGYHSTRLSRLADRVEALAVVLVLPLGVVAAGGIEALRRLTSG